MVKVVTTRSVVLGLLLGTAAATTYKVVDLYETSDCGDGSSPSRAIFTPSTNCEPSLTCAANSAFSDMGYGTTSCTNDFTSHAEDVLTGSCKVIEQKFSDDSCATESQVLAFTADSDLCVAQGTDKGVKWSVTGTGEVDLISYASSDCSGNPTSASRTEAADVSSHSCVDKQKFYVVGAEIQEARRYVTTTYYSDASCSTPSRIEFDVEAQGMICPESTQCSKSPNIDGVYEKSGCVLDYKKVAADTFGSEPYALQSLFYDNACNVDYQVLAYHADGSTIAFEEGVTGTFSFSGDTYNSRYIADGKTTSTLTLAVSVMNGECMGQMAFDAYNAPLTATTAPTDAPTETPEPTTASTEDANGALTPMVSAATAIWCILAAAAATA